MGEFKSYSFSNVNVIFGVLELQEFAEGDDVVTATPDKEQFSDMAGAKGDVTRSQTNDNRATIVIKLLQTSSSNKDLTLLYTADRATGAGVFPLVIQDKEAGETFICKNAWVQKYPDVKRGQAPNVMEWTFRTDSFTPVIL